MRNGLTRNGKRGMGGRACAGGNKHARSRRTSPLSPEPPPQRRRGLPNYFFTSGQREADSGWNASSPGIVRTSL